MKTKVRTQRQNDGEFALSAQIYKQKSCQVCMKKHNQANMILCDRCEDAYHIRCIGLLFIPEGVWICRQCKIDVNKIKQKQLMSKKPVEKGTIEQCAGCKQKMGHVFEFEEGQVQFEAKLISLITCSSCTQKYHSTCFSDRSTSINCRACEEVIRENIPKGFNEFQDFVKKSQQKIASLNYLELVEGLDEKSWVDGGCLPFLHLLAPQKQNDWRVIISYFASICYAIMTRGMTYTENLLIETKVDRIETVWRGHKTSVQRLYRLHKTDEMAYERFKKQLKEGQFPPLEVKQDRMKGFYMVSTNVIPSNTIIAEYVGELITARQSLNMIHNESIFTLIRNPRSTDSLDIAPSQFANIAIFISGINNSESQNVRLENVRALKFTYKGITRLLLVTTRDIKAGETLYLNYNGDRAMSEYPTNNFVV